LEHTIPLLRYPRIKLVRIERQSGQTTKRSRALLVVSLHLFLLSLRRNLYLEKAYTSLR
jgi:hypothetical protein